MRKRGSAPYLCRPLPSTSITSPQSAPVMVRIVASDEKRSINYCPPSAKLVSGLRTILNVSGITTCRLCTNRPSKMPHKKHATRGTGISSRWPHPNKLSAVFLVFRDTSSTTSQLSSGNRARPSIHSGHGSQTHLASPIALPVRHLSGALLFGS